MNERRYTQVVLRELKRLGELATSREQDSRLKEISAKLNRWKKGSMSSAAALAEIQRLSGASPLVWIDKADPGIHAAHAVASGFLKKKDFSESAWKSVEILITLAEI
ncbi:MAG: hypothetical protein DRP60_08765 [Spirochaetes bacterium]|nr:MAG: hypothetical protein DRP60_08765 [Spirochaetota bacterium]